MPKNKPTISNNIPDQLTDKCQQSLTKYFPGHLKGSEAEKLVADQLSKKGFTDQNTLFADCSCPDEVNHDDPTEDISSIFQTRWGEMFPLAGLAGMPFTGKTGWGAFSGHCVKDGNIVILFAPHVGVSSEGLVGKLHRDGQENISSA